MKPVLKIHGINYGVSWTALISWEKLSCKRKIISIQMF